jgi:hypothetical protein
MNRPAREVLEMEKMRWGRSESWLGTRPGFTSWTEAKPVGGNRESMSAFCQAEGKEDMILTSTTPSPRTNSISYCRFAVCNQ